MAAADDSMGTLSILEARIGHGFSIHIGHSGREEDPSERELVMGALHGMPALFPARRSGVANVPENRRR